jgi:transposase-like protein
MVKKRRNFSWEFKLEAAALVTEGGTGNIRRTTESLRRLRWRQTTISGGYGWTRIRCRRGSGEGMKNNTERVY